jgi:S1-C subfamily serine protease
LISVFHYVIAERFHSLDPQSALSCLLCYIFFGTVASEKVSWKHSEMDFNKALKRRKHHSPFMFSKATAQIRESLYGIMARTIQGQQTIHSMGSGVMIAPNYVITNAHLLHQNNDPTKPNHVDIEIIRSPDIGKNCIAATLHREDPARDLAILKITGATSTRCASFLETILPSGTSLGSLGFPLATVNLVNGGLAYGLNERFQGAYISAFFNEPIGSRVFPWYEVDRVMYGGSSGCPFFTVDGKVIGLQAKVRTDLSNGGSSQDMHNFLAISLVIPSTEIIKFAKDCGVIH